MLSKRLSQTSHADGTSPANHCFLIALICSPFHQSFNVRRIQYNLAKAGLDPEEVQSTMRSVKAGMESREKKARTIVQNDPEVKRLQAQLAEVRKQNSQSNNNVGLGF